MAIWSLEGTEKQVKALRKEIKDLLTQDESIKRAWEANFEDKWIAEAKERGTSDKAVDKGAMEREWKEEVALPTGKTRTGGNAFLSPIHVKALAVITGRPIIVVAMNDDRFPSMEAVGQFGGIYRAHGRKQGEREESKRTGIEIREQPFWNDCEMTGRTQGTISTNWAKRPVEHATPVRRGKG